MEDKDSIWKIILLLKFLKIFYLTYFILSSFIWPHLQPMEVPRLEGEVELRLQACTTATATLDPSHICALCHSLWHCQILNSLSEARDQTSILMDSYVGFLIHWATMGTPIFSFWGISILFSIVATPVYIPFNSVAGFPFLHTLSSIYYLWTY